MSYLTLGEVLKPEQIRFSGAPNGESQGDPEICLFKPTVEYKIENLAMQMFFYVAHRVLKTD